MSFRQILTALRARLGVFITVLLATVIAAAAVSYLLPKSYKATASLLVDAKDEQSLGSQQQAFNMSLPQERQSYLQTQMDILGSRKVARKVVDELQLAANPAAQQAFEKETGGEGAIEDWLVEGLQKRLKVETTQSNVIQTTFSASDPQFAMRAANAFAKAYMETMVELRTAPTREAAAWFDEQLKALRTNLENAQAKLTDYLQKQNMIVADDRYDIESARLATLSEQALRAREESAQAAARETQVRRSVESGDPDRMRAVNDNGVIQRLKADLLTGEARLHELSTQYGPNHPSYQRQLSANQSLRERVDAETRRVVSSAENIARQSRQREVSVEGALAAQRKHREAELANALAAQRSRILGQRANRDEASVLRRNVESAERAYDTAMQRSVIAQVESRVRQTNITLLNAAAVPRVASSPRIKLNLALAVLVGTMLGLAIVTLLEMGDRRVRSRDDLILASEVPVLGVLNAWQPSRNLIRGPDATGRALPSPS